MITLNEQQLCWLGLFYVSSLSLIAAIFDFQRFIPADVLCMVMGAYGAWMARRKNPKFVRRGE